MRVLLVEDNIGYAQVVEAKLNNLPDCEVIWVKSRAAAENALRQEDFDLILIDRKIPSADNALDGSIEHGFQVFQTANQVCEGTPAWFLTGTVDHEFPVEINNKFGRREDIHGTGKTEPLCMVFWKSSVDDALKEAKSFADQQQLLSNIAIQAPGGLNLSRAEQKNLRLFGRRYGASSVDVTSLGGGLSSARVVKVVARNPMGGPVHTSVAKIGDLSDVRDENQRYTAEITKLQAGGYPPLSLKIDAGSGGVGGVYYSMVGTDVTSLFQKLSARDGTADGVPAALRAIQQPWLDGAMIDTFSVAQIRRRFLLDTKLPEVETELHAIDRSDVEMVVVNAARCSQHNDMHALNVLFDNNARAMLIDFNDAGISFAAADAITLELSLIFHKEHATLGTEWPTPEQMSQWGDLEAYVEHCDFANFIRGCRQWAFETAGSREAVFAVAYSYALRQLKYEDTRKDLARALIKSTISQLTAK